MPQYLTLTLTVALLCLALSACSQSGDDGQGRSGNATQLYRLTGTVAVGRPAAWAEVCIEADCSRANQDGVYRLLSERQRSALMQATLENADQSVTELAGRYRHEPEQTVALVNVNPTTHALLDSWSQYQLGQTLAGCTTSAGCRDELINGFTQDRQQAAQQQLFIWLSPEWQTARNPFSDPYLADPELDWHDDLHDHVQLEATPPGLNALDNEGDTLDTLDYAT
ncbi:MAG: hypothetical protein R3311_22570, partial [Oceanisphaera sp.]|nr:hypothetical protein [Oceanisphaera sp.]